MSLDLYIEAERKAREVSDNLDSLSPTEVYLYMLSKMAGAPLHIYAEISVRLIMPILSEKLSSIPDSQGVNVVVKKEQ